MSLNCSFSLFLKKADKAVYTLVLSCVYIRPHSFLSSELLGIFRMDQDNPSAFIFTGPSASNAYPP